MSQRKTGPLERSTVRHTLHHFWWVTQKKPFATFMAVFTSVAYTALLTYANTWIMGLIVDRVQAEPVTADKVLARPMRRSCRRHVWPTLQSSSTVSPTGSIPW